MYQNLALAGLKDMYEPLVPMFFPVLGAHISGAEFHLDLRTSATIISLQGFPSSKVVVSRRKVRVRVNVRQNQNSYFNVYV